MTLDELRKYIDEANPPGPNTVPDKTHMNGKHDNHALQLSTKTLCDKGGVIINYQWATCPECEELRWSKIIGFHDWENMAIEKHFYKRRKDEVKN